MKTKMKAIRNIGLFAVSAALLIGCTACGGGGGGGGDSGDKGYDPVPNSKVTTYDNKSYNEYLLGEDATIENQWEGYGIGDPFVMRWNGTYYLYVSTLDSAIGVRGYKSADLINWQPMTGTGLKEGYVSQDSVTLAAYAPEVYYWNGTFYMYTSPAGRGHYILTSQNPEGPFVNQTENLGLSIDGSVFIDDDEKMYFTYAGDNGIQMSEMNGMLGVQAGPAVRGANIGGWTEGSYMMKRGGIYYLTYTGNHVASDGYRIAYSTATDIEDYSDAFTKAQNNPLALETETALKGIGHSSTVMGPDMDSYYLVYHYLNSSGGPNRSLGIDRLTFDGTMMSVAPQLEKSVKPSLPAFYATGTDGEKFETAGEFVLSNTSAPANFTAEYNLKGASLSTYVFGYADENNYFDVTVDLTEKTVKLNKTVDGTTTEVGSGTLVNDFSADKIHTVRVASRDGKVDVLFDNMTKIDDAALNASAGKIGYKSVGSAQVGYTAYSAVAMGMSDEQEAKQLASYTGAGAYLHGQDAFGKDPVLGTNSELETVTEDYRFDGWNALTLANEGDGVSYRLYNNEKGRYGLQLVYPASEGGKKIGISINGNKTERFTLPKLETRYEDEDIDDTELIKTIVAEFDLKEGEHVIRLENVGSAVTYSAFTFVGTSSVVPEFENNLSEYVSRGVEYKTIWKIKEDGGKAIGHYAKAGTRQLVYFGDNTITDFTLEVEIMLEGSTSSSTAGIVFHAKNYASSPHDTSLSIQGYYLNLKNDAVSLDKLNYADESENIVFDDLKSESDKFYKIKIQTRGNNMRIWIDGEEIFNVNDDWNFANGKIGLYTDGAAAVYRNLKISG